MITRILTYRDINKKIIYMKGKKNQEVGKIKHFSNNISVAWVVFNKVPVVVDYYDLSFE
ncbi:MAG: hypothetical protein KAS32_00205 [Candidatus Peribacteraceae bacterium]|nr:hypothetical protein [Candidatus Peribacteraceae bacterium]